MIGASITRTGCGDAIVRRQPRLPSCITVQPSSAASRRATSSLMNEPIGLSGLRERRIADVDQRLRDQRDHRLVDAAALAARSPIAFWNMKPIAPCVSATA